MGLGVRESNRQFMLGTGLCLSSTALAIADLYIPALLPWGVGGAVALAAIGLIVMIQARSLALDAEAIWRAEEANLNLLQMEIERHRQAVDLLAEGLDVQIFLVDRRTSILYANQNAEDAFRFQEPVGHRLLSVTFSADLERLVEDASTSGRPRRQEITFHHPLERVGIAQAWAEPPTGERIFVAIYDISALRRLERVRRDFVANVSHELRTPMTTIRAMAETLQDEGEEDHELLRRYLERIVKEIDRLTRITSDLLTLSIAESQPPNKEYVDLGIIARESVAMLLLKAESKDLDLNVIGEPSLPLMANGEQLTQVAVNLIDNALSCTPRGQVMVKLSRDGQWARMDVIDTGIGIASEHLPRIFERFYRVDRGRSRARGGTGLGLSIVRHIVESHQGRVSVESALNVGSTFTVLLPIDLDEDQ